MQSQGESPSILRSIDGEDFFAAETTATLASEIATAELDWLNLVNFDGDFAVTSSENIPFSPPERRVFVSNAGADWREIDTSDVIDSGVSFVPISFDQGTMFGVAFRGLSNVNDFLAATTTIEIPEEGSCQVSRSGSTEDGGLTFDIFDCNGEVVDTLDADDVVDPESANQVFSCLQGLLNARPFSVDLVSIELSGSGQLTTVGQFTPNGLPLGVSQNRIAGVDSGQAFDVPDELCEGLIDRPEASPPSVFIADQSEITRFPLPGDNELVQQGSTVVGEVSVGGRDYLVIVQDRALWALDLETSQWSGPLTSADTPFPNGIGQQVTLSETGSRAYAVANSPLVPFGFSLLVTFDFVEGPNGSLEVVETLRQISLIDGPRAALSAAAILYADDEVVFVGTGIEAWSLDAPPLASE